MDIFLNWKKDRIEKLSYYKITVKKIRRPGRVQNSNEKVYSQIRIPHRIL